MKSIRKAKWAIIVLLLVFIAGWIYIRYTNRDFLRYGVLHINKLSNSLMIINDEFAGFTDQEYSYTISIDPLEFDKLLAGRVYTKQTQHTKCNTDGAKTFPVDICYTSGELKNGLVTVFVNADRSMAYIVYNID